VVAVKGPIHQDPDILVRVSHNTASLIRHLMTVAKGQTLRQIMAGIREENPGEDDNNAKLEADWLLLFEDSLKADAIFLTNTDRKIQLAHA
jgi:hypothetical protein